MDKSISFKPNKPKHLSNNRSEWHAERESEILETLIAVIGREHQEASTVSGPQTHPSHLPPLGRGTRGRGRGIRRRRRRGVIPLPPTGSRGSNASSPPYQQGPPPPGGIGSQTSASVADDIAVAAVARSAAVGSSVIHREEGMERKGLKGFALGKGERRWNMIPTNRII